MRTLNKRWKRFLAVTMAMVMLAGSISTRTWAENEELSQGPGPVLTEQGSEAPGGQNGSLEVLGEENPLVTNEQGGGTPGGENGESGEQPVVTDDVKIKPFWQENEVYEEGQEITLWPQEWTDSPAKAFDPESVFADEEADYEPYIVSVSKTTGASYDYNEGDTAFTPEAKDQGKAYKVVYGVKKDGVDMPASQLARSIQIAKEAPRPAESVILERFWTTNAYPSEQPVTLFPQSWIENPSSAFSADSYLYEEYTYTPFIVRVASPSGASYTYKSGDTEFTPAKSDEGKAYVVTYGVRKNGFDADNKEITAARLTRTVNIALPVPAVTERIRFNAVPNRNIESGQSVDIMLPEWAADPALAFADSSIFEEGYTYRPFVKNVITPNGGSYVYKSGDTSFTARDQDKDKAYTVSYGAERSNDGGKTWTPVEGVETEGKIIVKGDRKTIDHITGDEVRVSNLQVEVFDGTDPFDSVSYNGSANKGMDSSKTNGVVRTFDSIDYRLKFSTVSKNPNNNYKEGYMRFEVNLPRWNDQQAAFDFTAMSFMESGSGNPYAYEFFHYKKLPGGETIYLTTDNRIVTAEGVEVDLSGTPLTPDQIAAKTADQRTNDAVAFKQSFDDSSDDNGQRLIFYYHIKQVEDTNGNLNEAYPSTGTLPVVVNVMRMSNDDVLQPSFKASVVQEMPVFEQKKDETGAPLYWNAEWEESTETAAADGTPYEPVMVPATDENGNLRIQAPALIDAKRPFGRYDIIYEAQNRKEIDAEFPEWQHNLSDSPDSNAQAKKVVVTCTPSYAVRLHWADEDYTHIGPIKTYDLSKTVWTTDRLANFGVQPADQAAYVNKEVYYVTTAAGARQYTKSVRSGFNDDGSAINKTLPIVAGDIGPDGQPARKSQQNAPNTVNKTFFGRVSALGVAIQLFNSDVDKGLRGIEFPKEGEAISFKIRVAADFNKAHFDQTLAPILYDAGASHYEGVNFSPWSGRDVYTARSGRNYPYKAAPYNSNADAANNPYSAAANRYVFRTSPANSDRVWWGGVWDVKQTGNTPGGTGYTELTVTVKDFVINPNWFPNKDVAIENTDTGNFYYPSATGAMNTNVGTISAGEIFLLMPHSVLQGPNVTYEDNYARHVFPDGKKWGNGNLFYSAEFTSLSIVSESGDVYTLNDEKWTGDTRTGKIESEGGQDDFHELNHIMLNPGGWTEQIWYTHKDNFVHANAENRTRNIASYTLGANGTSNLSQVMSDQETLGGKVGIYWRGNRSNYNNGGDPARAEFMVAKFDGSVLIPIMDDIYRQPRVAMTWGSEKNGLSQMYPDTSQTVNNPKSQAYNETLRDASGNPRKNAEGQTLYRYYKEVDKNGNVALKYSPTLPDDPAYANVVYGLYDPLDAVENTDYYLGFKKNGSNWTGQAEMTNTHKEDLIWVKWTNAKSLFNKDTGLFNVGGRPSIAVAIAANIKYIKADTYTEHVDSIAYFDIVDEIISTRRSSFLNPTLPDDGKDNRGYVASCEVEGNSWTVPNPGVNPEAQVWPESNRIVYNHVSSLASKSAEGQEGNGENPLSGVANHAADRPSGGTTNYTGKYHGFEKADYSTGAYRTTKYYNLVTYYRGDSLYLMPYNTVISKSNVQQIYDRNTGRWSAKTTWDLDNAEERVADFMLVPGFNTGGVAHENDPTLVYIEDTLPSGMTYKPGSSVFISQVLDDKGYPVYRDTKGTNTEDDDDFFSTGRNKYYFVTGSPSAGFVNTGTEYPDRTGITSNDTIVWDGEYLRDVDGLAGRYKGGAVGTYTTPQGQTAPTEPEVEDLGAGRTRLTWTIPSDNVGDFLPRIYYSVDLQKEAGAFAKSLSNTAIITSEKEDEATGGREQSRTRASGALGNLATASINLVSPSLIMTLKVPDKASAASGTPLTYTVQFANANADTDWDRAVMMDTLPSNDPELWKLQKDLEAGDVTGRHYLSQKGTHAENYNVFTVSEGSHGNTVPRLAGNVKFTLPTFAKARDKVYIKDYVLYYTTDLLGSRITAETLSTNYYNNPAYATDENGNIIEVNPETSEAYADKDGNPMPGLLYLNSVKTGEREFVQTIFIDGAEKTVTWKKAQNIPAGDPANADGVSIAEDGTVKGLDKLDVSAFFLYGTMKASSSVRANMGVDTKGAEPGDTFTNLSSVEGNVGPASGKIIDRILSGTVWFDENKDGKRADGEELIPDVTVTLERFDGEKWVPFEEAKVPKKLYDAEGKPFDLYDENGEQIYFISEKGNVKTISDAAGNIIPVYDENGNETNEYYEKSSTTLTDENGFYEFRGLDEGQYRVRFTGSAGFDLGEYRTTVMDVNNQYKVAGELQSVDGERDSDGQPVYDADGNLSEAVIENYRIPGADGPIPKILLPTDEEITRSPYRVDFQDLGLIRREDPDKHAEDEEANRIDDKLVAVGEKIPYKIFYGNDSATNTADITLKDVVDPGLTVIEGSISDEGRLYKKGAELPDGTKAQYDTIIWRILRVPAGAADLFVTFSAQVNDLAFTDRTVDGEPVKPGQVKNKASVTNHYYPESTDIPDDPPGPDPTGSVLVQHVTTDGKVLIPWTSVLKDAEVGTPYETFEETFPGYRLVKVDTENYDEPSGAVIEGTKKVLYIYEPDPDYEAPKGDVVVRHVDIYGNPMPGEPEGWTPVVEGAEEGTSYSTHENIYEGYELVRVDDDAENPLVGGGEDYAPASGAVEADTTKHVTYVYRPKDARGSVVVEHRAVKTEPVLDPDGNQVFDDEGLPVYEPVLDENGNYIIESVLDPWADVVRDGIPGEDYATKRNYYADYELIAVDAAYDEPSGKVEAGVTKQVVYLYRYRGDAQSQVGDVVVEHRAVKVDASGKPMKDGSGNYIIEKVLAPWADVQKNQPEGTEYTTANRGNKAFKYQVEVDDPANPGEKKTVTRYYEVLDTAADKLASPVESVSGADPHYDDPTGTVTAGQVKKVVYLYIPSDPATPPEEPKDPGSVRVKYVDEDGNVLKDWEDVIKDGEDGTPYKTVQERFSGYVFKEMDPESEDPSGTVEAGRTKDVIYVYKKAPTPGEDPETGSVVVRHVLEDGTVLKDWADVSTGKPYTGNDEELTKLPDGSKYNTYPERFTADGKTYELVRVDDDPFNPLTEGGEDYSPASGTVEKDTVKHVTYVYREVETEIDPKGSVVVEHRSTTGEILKPWSPAKDPDGNDTTGVDPETPYISSPEDFRGYRFKEMDPASEAPEGVVEAGKVKEVIYLYEPMEPGCGDVRVEHRVLKLDEEGKPVKNPDGSYAFEEILDPWKDVYRDAPAGTEYLTTPNFYETYELVELEDITGGVDPAYDAPAGMVEEGRVKSIVYLYLPKNPENNPDYGDVVVEHRAVKLDENGQPLKDENGKYVIETVLEPWTDVVKNGKAGDPYTTQEGSFTYTDANGEEQDYELLTVDPDGDPAEGEVEGGKTKKVVYLYVPKDPEKPPVEPEKDPGSVKVRYLYEDEDGNLHELKPGDPTNPQPLDPDNPNWEDVVKDGPDGSPYSTVKERFPGYEFDRTEGDPVSGIVESEKTKEITYIYKKAPEQPGSVTVEHRAVDDEGNITKILKKKEYVKENEPGGTPYETSWLGDPEEIYEDPETGELYERVAVEGEPSGEVEPGKTKEIIYTYKKIPVGDVLVQHVTENGKVLKPWAPAKDPEGNDTVKAREGTEYVTDWLGDPETQIYTDENGNEYLRVKVDENYDDPTGTVSADKEKRVVYIYKLKPGTPTDPEDPYTPPTPDPETPPPTTRETPVVENPLPDKRYAEDSAAGKGQSQVTVGDVIKYEIFFGNGDKDEAGGPIPAEVVITDVIDAGLDVAADSISRGGVYDEASRTITWKFTAEPGEFGSVTFEAKVNEKALEKNKVENSAAVKVGENPEKDTRSLINPIPRKRYAETSSAGKDGKTVKVGDRITYEIAYAQYHLNANYRKVDADVVITDVIDPGLDVVAGSISAGGVYDEASRTITWTLKAVPYGTEDVVSFTAAVNESAQGKTVENVATVTITDPKDPENPDSQETPDPQNPKDSKQTEKLSNPVPKKPSGFTPPDTGDTARTGLYGIVFMSAALAMLALLFIERKRRLRPEGR